MWNQLNVISKATIAVMVITLGWTVFVLVDWYLTYDHMQMPMMLVDAVEVNTKVTYHKTGDDQDRLCLRRNIRLRGQEYTVHQYLTDNDKIMEKLRGAGDDCDVKVYNISVSIPTITFIMRE